MQERSPIFARVGKSFSVKNTEVKPVNQPVKRNRRRGIIPESLKDIVAKEYRDGKTGTKIMSDHNISSGVMYRILEERKVPLRQSESDTLGGKRRKDPLSQIAELRKLKDWRKLVDNRMFGDIIFSYQGDWLIESIHGACTIDDGFLAELLELSAAINKLAAKMRRFQQLRKELIPIAELMREIGIIEDLEKRTELNDK